MGRISFTDRPDSNLPAQALGGPALEAPKPPARLAPFRMTSRHSATLNVNEAGRRLAQAQLNRSNGADVLAADWTHGPGDGVPNERYWQRQDKLRVQVEKAQDRANETRLSLLARS